MSGTDDDRFLSRWSRRKVAAREGKPLEEPPPPADDSPPAPAGESATGPGAPTGEREPSAELPPIESLRGLASDYRDFMRANVDPALKRAALRKLFADPHFNVMDGLDIYIDDYSIPDPIPEAMLAKLEHAKTLFRPLQEARDAAAREAAEVQAAAAAVEEGESHGETEGATTECPGAPTVPASGPDEPRGEVGIEESR
jgi:hypothetical protein